MSEDISTELNDEQREEFKALLEKRGSYYSIGRKMWSFAYHSILYMSIISSAAAAIIPQLRGVESVYITNLASILAGLAAVLLTLSTVGGLERKWKGNRVSSGRIRDLEVELIGRRPTKADVTILKEIQKFHDKEILG